MRAIARIQAVFVVLVLLVAACGDDAEGGDTTTTADQGTTTTTTQGTTTTTAATTTTTTEAEPESVEVALDPPPEDPDPLMTIIPLETVTVSWDAAGNLVFTFPDAEMEGVGLTLTNVEGATHVGCDAFGDGTGCNAQLADGFVFGPVTPDGPDVPPNSVVAAMTVTMDSITLTVEGQEFTGDGLLLSDGAGMVQIDPNTGGLAEPVTRRQGVIAAADLYAALYG